MTIYENAVENGSAFVSLGRNLGWAYGDARTLQHSVPANFLVIDSAATTTAEQIQSLVEQYKMENK